MQGFSGKEDLRVVKTQNAISNSISTLLQRRRFKQITVNELCLEAIISRAAFYTHYRDKFDLLEKWFYGFLTELKTEGVENVIDSLIYNNSKLMQNILYDADTETAEIVVSTIITSILDECPTLPDSKKTTAEYQVLCKFCAGGMYEMIKWQNNQKFSPELQNTQKYFYDLFKAVLNFHIMYK